MERISSEDPHPEEQVQDPKTGRRVTTRNFLPGYIFVNMELNEHTWHLVNTPKVSGFVGGRHPAPGVGSGISTIESQVAEAPKPKPRVVFNAGDHVRVTDGAFANFTGTIQK